MCSSIGPLETPQNDATKYVSIYFKFAETNNITPATCVCVCMCVYSIFNMLLPFLPDLYCQSPNPSTPSPVKDEKATAYLFFGGRAIISLVVLPTVDAIHVKSTCNRITLD